MHAFKAVAVRVYPKGAPIVQSEVLRFTPWQVSVFSVQVSGSGVSYSGRATTKGTKSTKGEREKRFIHSLLRVLRGEMPCVIYGPVYGDGFAARALAAAPCTMGSGS